MPDTCPECGGSGWYQGLNNRKPCSRGCPDWSGNPERQQFRVFMDMSPAERLAIQKKIREEVPITPEAPSPLFSEEIKARRREQLKKSIDEWEAKCPTRPEHLPVGDAIRQVEAAIPKCFCTRCTKEIGMYQESIADPAFPDDMLRGVCMRCWTPVEFEEVNRAREAEHQRIREKRAAQKKRVPDGHGATRPCIACEMIRTAVPGHSSIQPHQHTCPIAVTPKDIRPCPACAKPYEYGGPPLGLGFWMTRTAQACNFCGAYV